MGTPMRLAGPSRLTNSAATLFTSSGRTQVDYVHVDNPSGSPVDLTLSIGADAAGTRIIDGLSVPADSEREFRFFFVLEDTEILQGFASTDAVLDLIVNGQMLPSFERLQVSWAALETPAP